MTPMLASDPIDIRLEPIADKIGVEFALLHMHWEEVALNKEVMVLKPDVARYQDLEASGVLHSLVAYAGDQIVGYSVNFLTSNLHYADLVYVQNDVLFVHPDYRKSSVGRRLIQATEVLAKELGARMMLWHAKPDTPLSALLPRAGYGVQDVMFSKVL